MYLASLRKARLNISCLNEATLFRISKSNRRRLGDQVFIQVEAVHIWHHQESAWSQSMQKLQWMGTVISYIKKGSVSKGYVISEG